MPVDTFSGQAAEAKISPRKKHAIHLHTKPAKKNLVVGRRPKPTSLKLVGRVNAWRFVFCRRPLLGVYVCSRHGPAPTGLPFNWEALLEDKLLGSKRGPGVASQKKY